MKRVNPTIILGAIVVMAVVAIGIVFISAQPKPVTAQDIPLDSWGCVKWCQLQPDPMGCIMRNCVKQEVDLQPE